MVSTFAPGSLDVELARAYRKGVDRNWMLNYFKFPEQPTVLGEATHAKIQEACTAIIEILRRVSDEALAGTIELEGKSLLERLDIPNHCLYWLEQMHRPGATVLWGRPDFHLKNGEPWLLESNLASAAGYQQQVSGLIEYYAGHPQYLDDFEEGRYRVLDPMRAFKDAIEARTRPGELVVMPDIFEKSRFDNDEVVPYGGLVSWLNTHSTTRFTGAFIHKMSLRQDGVYVEGRRVDHIFMSYYNPHVFDRADEFLPFWDLARRGKVNLLDSLSEVLWSNKLLLAFVSEFVDDLDLDPAHVEVWKRTVPWTRIIRPGKTTFAGELVDIESFAMREKRRLVIKKAQSAEGKMVFVGKDVPQEAWDATVLAALKDGKWILQEFIEPEMTTLHMPQEGGFEPVEAMQTLSPYVIGTEVVGYLNRYYRFDLEESDSNSASVVRLPPVGTAVIATDGPQHA